MLSRSVIAFFPMEQASFNFMVAVTVAVILEPKKIKSVNVSFFFFSPPSIHHEVMGLHAMILVFLPKPVEFRTI